MLQKERGEEEKRERLETSGVGCVCWAFPYTGTHMGEPPVPADSGTFLAFPRPLLLAGSLLTIMELRVPCVPDPWQFSLASGRLYRTPFPTAPLTSSLSLSLVLLCCTLSRVMTPLKVATGAAPLCLASTYYPQAFKWSICSVIANLTGAGTCFLYTHRHKLPNASWGSLFHPISVLSVHLLPCALHSTLKS